MTNSRNIALTNIGLRAYDTAIGFRNLDIRSAALTEFDPTHTIGMARHSRWSYQRQRCCTQCEISLKKLPLMF